MVWLIVLCQLVAIFAGVVSAFLLYRFLIQKILPPTKIEDLVETTIDRKGRFLREAVVWIIFGEILIILLFSGPYVILIVLEKLRSIAVTE